MRASGIVGALMMLAGACTPDFDNPTTVHDLRVLAVTAEPPEIFVGPSTTALPDITLEPLIVDPKGAGRRVSYVVTACSNLPVDLGRGRNRGPANARDTISRDQCPEGSPVIAQGDAAPGPDGVVPVKITFTPPPTLLSVLRAADEQTLRELEFGLPVTLTLVVTAGDESATTIKRIIISTPFPEYPAQRPNRNPRVTTLQVRKSRDDTAMPYNPAAPPRVPLGGELRLSASKDEAAAQAEPYQARRVTTRERSIVEVEAETLRFAFFATKGGFSPGNTNTEPSLLITNPVVDLESTYRAPKLLEPGESPEVEVFVVVRDERGGASFVRMKIVLE